MKKVLTRILISAALGVSLIAATPQPLTVINTLSDLLSKPATRGETMLVLGTSQPFDAPVRLAKHFTNIAYPIDNISVFAATNGGEWYLTYIGSTATSRSVATIYCSQDATSHNVTISMVDGYYLLSVDQDPSTLPPSAITVDATDGTKHHLIVMMDGLGNYTISVDQDPSLDPSVPLSITAIDQSSHLVSLYSAPGGFYAMQVSQ